jgi:putative phosphoribosyl transferase
VYFTDRAEAGRRLGAALRARADTDVVVVALPRGGVPVAYEAAAALGAPLDVVVVRKLGAPFQPELALGAIGEQGARVVNEELIGRAHVSGRELAAIEARERTELQRRARRFRGDRPAVPLDGRTVIIVDDGVATGSTARAACRVARARGARKVVLAVPVGPPDVRARMRPDADEVVCLSTPELFFSVGQHYADFAQTSDAEVVELIEHASRSGSGAGGGAGSVDCGRDSPDVDAEVTVRIGALRLAGHLTVPTGAPTVVVFAHGSGSSRHSPRNRFVAAALNARGLGTLLFDLLTTEEEVDRGNVFDIDLLGARLRDVTTWLRADAAAGLGIGYFGASTGAAAALWAAAEPGADVAAVVSRGGRPDLAGARLGLVRAPTLLIVGGLDDVVLELNRSAQARLTCDNALRVVPGATHLFEEPGTLEAAARLAGDWFVTYGCVKE